MNALCRLGCTVAKIRALCLTTNALCRTAEIGALLLKYVLIVYIWPEKGVCRCEQRIMIRQNATTENVRHIPFNPFPLTLYRRRVASVGSGRFAAGSWPSERCAPSARVVAGRRVSDTVAVPLFGRWSALCQ